MKRITAILALTMLTALVASPLMAAGVPGTINLQGRFTDGAGNNVADGVYTVAFRIYDDAIAGNTLWSETLPVQVTDGLYAVRAGTTSAIPADLFSSGANRYLGVTVNLNPEMPRIPLSSVAYSYRAKDADVATLAQDLTCAGCVSASDVDPAQVQLRVTGTAPVGQYITSINQNGTVATAADANSTYTAGTGLVLNGTQFAIAPNGVTATEIAANAVGSAEIAVAAVGTTEVADNSLLASDISADAVTSSEIAAGAVVGGFGGNILDASITADDIAPSAVGSSEIATDAVGSLEIAADAVFATEIAASAVGSSEIAAGAVGSSEIGADAVGTSEVADGSLSAVDIDDEPGVASNTSNVIISMDGTVQTLLSRTITAPAAGYVLAIATAAVLMDHTNSTLSRASFGVSSTAGVFPANQSVSVQVSGSAPTGDYSLAVTVHGLFSTPGGPDTFYFLGDETWGDFIMSHLQLTLIYFPTAHGTVVSTAAASGGEIISYESADPPPGGDVPPRRTVLPETGGEPVQSQVAEGLRQRADLAGIQQELARVKSETEARIQKLEEHLRVIETKTDEKR